jgi:hypothetical protein
LRTIATQTRRALVARENRYTIFPIMRYGPGDFDKPGLFHDRGRNALRRTLDRQIAG